MKDLIIIGGGPAGISAAVYAARKKLDFSIITKDIGGQTAWSADIENYPGFQFITGVDLVSKFREHIEKYKFDLLEGMEVSSVKKDGKNFKIEASSGESFSARTLIIASGKKPRMLNVPGEREYKNKGVAYCSTCDGPLFAGKTVAVIGGGNSALDAALAMMKIAKKVYLINIHEKFIGDAVMQDKVKAAPNVEILAGTKTLEIVGEKFVKGIKVETKGKSLDIALEGVFIEIGMIPNSDFIDCVEKNEDKEVLIDSASQTSCPGIFAAGDVTDVPDKQIIIAAGDGAKASLAAFKYLSTH